MRFIIIFVCLISISSCSTKPYVIKKSDIYITSPQRVYILNHGRHTGFVIPAKTIQAQLPQLKKRFKNTPFIEFGWGDKGFYLADKITSGVTIRALFWPTESVIHAVAVPDSIETYFPNSQVKVLCLQEREYSKLVTFVVNSFYKDDNGEIVPLKHGIYGNSQFYKAVGKYYLMNTCNKWTAKGLSSAGMDISTTFKLTAGSIMDYLSAHQKPQSK